MRLTYFKSAIFLATAVAFHLSGIHSIHITKITGEDQPLAEFSGIKMLVVVLPVTRTAEDSAFLRNLDSVSQAYPQSLAVIGVPSIEHGYESEELDELNAYYSSLLGNRVTIARGVYTRKSSGSQQHALFRWLTYKEENIHFDLEVEGPRQKFFVNGQGKLYAVASPQVRLSGRLMQQMMAAQ